MNTEIKQDIDIEPKGKFLGKICPVDGAVCDRKCGYPAHGTLKRAMKPVEEDK